MTSPAFGHADRAALATRVLAILNQDTGRTDADLIELTGASPADLNTVIGMLYRQRRADRCGPYLVAVPGHSAPPEKQIGVTAGAVTLTPPRACGARNDPLGAALAYARLGWPVFWLGRSKRPVANCPDCKDNAHDPARCRHLTCHGFHAATTDPDRITAMRRTVPGGLLAIRTGTISGLALLDIDPRNGGHLDTTLMTPTAAVASGGGGWHLYYRHPGDPLPDKLPGHPGVDVKADGGYVVAPPSVHPGTGKPYQWAGDRAVDEMAPALRAALTPPPAPVTALVTATLIAPLRAAGAGAISDPAALLAAHLRAVQHAPMGKRRVTLYGAARGVARMVLAGAITPDDAVAALTAAGQAAGQAPPQINAAIKGGFQAEGAAA